MRVLAWVVGVLAISVSVQLCKAAEVTKTNLPAQSEEGRYRSALLFASVVELIRDEYLELEKTDYDKMTYAALRGLLSSLDPHSQFLDPEHYKMIRTETEGQFGGLGISVGMMENQLTVNVPIEGGPGFRAGLLPGDRIIKIEGKGTQKLTLGESIRLLRGRPGVPVQLTIYRPGDGKTIELSVVREMIQVPTLQDTKLVSGVSSQGEKIGYLRITQFGEKTATEFDSAIGQLEKEGATALILDLRDNPGGLVDAAVEVVSRFVPGGTLVVATEGRKAGAGRQEYLSRAVKLRVRWPTIVLVNGNTASAAEIVAGALQDLGLAVIMGETTFGKGSVQTVQRVDPSVIPDVGVRLTTAHYTTPSRRKIHGVGIEPDVIARLTRSEEQAIFQKRSPGLKKANEEVLEVNDEPLDRAIDLLRGWKVVKRRVTHERSP
ncbi:MAG: S41 family peptidase [Verrucomicrobia bacterium]|nr:S41 family peptidase [Verrucomicrobiota bacterium]NBT23724.1 S41 family peptidase [bacterium]NBY66127.1 S41 family peptidase [Verrucomicrobiota bacterium]